MNTEFDDVYDKIVELCKKGDKYQEAGKYDEAIEQYKKAFHFVPEPKSEWEASTWILTALGETYFFKDEYENARDTLQSALACPNALGNPFIHLRLGQAQFELGDLKKAADELIRAYMGDGKDIFTGEDSKYFRFVKRVINL